MRVSVSNLTFGYDYRTVLKDISFVLKSGDFLAVIGNNGSGKSTLIKCILGINKITPNRIRLDDVDVVDYKNYKNIGYVPQKFDDFNYEFPITVNEILQVSKYTDFTEDQKLELLDKVGILELQHENINNLSGGQLQRVFIARSLMNDPKLLILDEPTVGVDRENVEGFYKTINELNKEGITIMLITHNIHESKANFTHVLSLHNGEAVFREVSGGDE
ncbi:MAG: High-affinity zinc uptake system ATP-binding protein ZnuC [Candidatus Izimaplasma bacterium HR2]|nr:MAG: High-affinity zinc uptake system ATP-binding protein ZnuC [Candidatus Izimaplasma bacterium HR2]